MNTALTVEEMIAAVSAPSLRAGAAVAIAESLIWLGAEPGSRVRLFINDGSRSQVARGLARLEDIAAVAPPGLEPYHRPLLRALLGRLSHRHDRRAKVLRRWLWLEPQAVIEAIEAYPHLRLSHRRMHALVLRSMHKTDPVVQRALQAALTRRPDWLPNRDFVSQIAHAMMAAAEPDTRRYGLGLLELARVVVPSAQITPALPSP